MHPPYHKKVWFFVLGMLPLLAGLSACTPTVEEMVEDEELREAVLEECNELGLAMTSEEKCQNAIRAELQAARMKINEQFAK